MEKNSVEGLFAATVGTFDGVHRGHRAVLDALKGYAETHGLRPLVVTFDRHPLATVAPDRVPRLLQTPKMRDEMLKGCGVEVEEVAFTADVCRLTTREWMEVLRDRYGVRAIVTGYDNKFGSDGRKMQGKEYVRLGKELGIDVIEADELPGICSSAIRKAVEMGEMEEAARMLGRRYSLTGTVEEGRHLGRQLGFPTANLKVPPALQLPAPGVYAGYLDGRTAVVNIGNNPTIGKGNPVTIEAHVIDYSGDLYGKRVTLEFAARIREERKFAGLENLKAQIEKDKEMARRMLREE